MTSSNTNYFPKALSSNMITFRVRTLAYEFGGHMEPMTEPKHDCPQDPTPRVPECLLTQLLLWRTEGLTWWSRCFLQHGLNVLYHSRQFLTSLLHYDQKEPWCPLGPQDSQRAASTHQTPTPWPMVVQSLLTVSVSFCEVQRDKNMGKKSAPCPLRPN